MRCPPRSREAKQSQIVGKPELLGTPQRWEAAFLRSPFVIIAHGAPEKVVRTVTENSRTLKFKSQGFEEE